nr:ATP-binding cassette domain-containing protein [Rhodococcus sp. 06-621-2]
MNNSNSLVDPAVISIRGVHKRFAVRRGGKRTEVRAVNGVDLALYAGETLSLVGESGCGKSTLAKMILGLSTPTEGTIEYRGHDVHCLRGADLRDFRRGVQAVVQDPRSSLNPRKRIGWIIGEPLHLLRGLRGKELDKAVARLLTEVSLDPKLMSSYPHELSGGMRQRVAIARALSISPDVIILDEPVSALDVSVRAQIINLLRDIQESHGVSYFMISHDLATVGYLSDRIAVMNAGEIVEQGPAERILASPEHPYTQELWNAAHIENLTGDTALEPAAQEADVR